MIPNAMPRGTQINENNTPNRMNIAIIGQNINNPIATAMMNQKMHLIMFHIVFICCVRFICSIYKYGYCHI